MNSTKSQEMGLFQTSLVLVREGITKCLKTGLIRMTYGRCRNLFLVNLYVWHASTSKQSIRFVLYNWTILHLDENLINLKIKKGSIFQDF